jgi:hypothetical protein
VTVYQREVLRELRDSSERTIEIAGQRLLAEDIKAYPRLAEAVWRATH